MGKFTIIIKIIIIVLLLSSMKIVLFLNIVNQCVRTPVRESALSHTTPENF